MRKIYTILFLLFFSLNAKAVTCEELMAYIKDKSYGTTYQSYDSESISKVTFYEITIDYKTYYYAIVCFKGQYGIGCSEYIYQVASNTKFNYSVDYYTSAGKAFWKYIQPYSKVLGCSPSFE